MFYQQFDVDKLDLFIVEVFSQMFKKLNMECNIEDRIDNSSSFFVS